jgi:hypothetical protein
LVGVIVALVVGTALWLPVVLRAGGLSALIDDPATVHLEQFGLGYGSVGYAIVLGAVLVVLWMWLGHPSPKLRGMLIAAGAVALVAAICLQTRGPLIATATAAVVLVLRERHLRRRQVATAAALAVVLLYGLFFMRQVRDYTQTQPFGVAVTSALQRNPLTLPSADFAELDGFVAVHRLVPEALPWLDGSSVADIPGTFVPRQLWGDKPYPIDRRVASKLYGDGASAGTPFTLVGELYWNFGFGGALLAMAVAGALAGLGWRALLALRPPFFDVVRATVTGYTYLLLTRPVGPMMLTLAFGLVGVGVAAFAIGTVELGPILRRLRSRAQAAAR